MAGDRLTRRALIASGAAAAFAVKTVNARSWSSERVLPSLLTTLRDQSVVHALGVAYRQSHPRENDVAVLEHLLLQSGHNPERSDRIRREFVDRKTVTLHGWILSITEARECALFSLTHS